MANPNDTPAPTKPLMAGCQQEPCSLSSGSEVDAAFPLSTNWNFPDSPEYLQQRAVAVKLENERNKMTAFASDLLREKRKLVALCERAKSICLGDGDVEDSDDWLTDYAAFLSENESRNGAADSGPPKQ